MHIRLLDAFDTVAAEGVLEVPDIAVADDGEQPVTFRDQLREMLSAKRIRLNTDDMGGDPRLVWSIEVTSV